MVNQTNKPEHESNFIRHESYFINKHFPNEKFYKKNTTIDDIKTDPKLKNSAFHYR